MAKKTMTDPKPTTNEQIALELEWYRLATGMWRNPNGSNWNGVPDFEHAWEHAGPLQVEMANEFGWLETCQRIYKELTEPGRSSYEIDYETELAQAISRAWLAWKKEGKQDAEEEKENQET